MNTAMNSKVPAATLAFWIIKICATTLGETGGDMLSMTLGLGYVASSAVFVSLFLLAMLAQVRSKRYHPFLFWAVILATTTAGTTMSDYLDRSAGLGYVRGSLMLLAALAAMLLLWHFTVGKISYSEITTPKVEVLYWFTILFSNTLGTALGDAVADVAKFGYEGGALVFGMALALVALAYFRTRVSHTVLFWMAFVLTRPLGATLGDELTKSHAKGGLDLGTVSSSLVVGMLLIAMITFAGRRAEAPSRRA